MALEWPKTTRKCKMKETKQSFKILTWKSRRKTNISSSTSFTTTRWKPSIQTGHPTRSRKSCHLFGRRKKTKIRCLPPSQRQVQPLADRLSHWQPRTLSSNNTRKCKRRKSIGFGCNCHTNQNNSGRKRAIITESKGDCPT